MIRKSFVFLALVVGAVFAFAQFGPSAKSPKVQVAPISPVSIARGKSAQVEFNFRVLPGFHINSNQPKSEFMVPTVLKLDPPSDVVIGKLSYPAGQDRSFPFAPDEKLNVYTGDFTVHAMVITTQSVPYGTYRVHGALKYQACDHAACYPPTSVPVEFDVHVVKPARAAMRNPRQSPHIH